MTTTMSKQPGSHKRALIVLTSAVPTMADGKTKSGYYWSEVYHPYEVFAGNGYTVDAVSLTGTASVDETSVATGSQLLQFEVAALAAYHNKSHPLHTIIAQLKTPAQVNPADYGIIFFAGGHACLWDLPTATPIHQIAAAIYEQGGVVGAVCHGPAVLGGLKLSNGTYLVQGKRANAFTVEEEQKLGVLDWMRQHNLPVCSDLITKAGGQYVKGDPLKEFVVNDGRLVTGQNPASATATAQRVIDVVQGKVR